VLARAAVAVAVVVALVLAVLALDRLILPPHGFAKR